METLRKKLESPSLAYVFKKALYLNTTSRCPSACRFCIKFSWSYKFHGYELKLPKDPTVPELLNAIPNDLRPFDEVVYCGYGESTYRLADLPALSEALRKRGARRIRLNTIGLGNLIQGRDIAQDLSKVVDAVCISLNTTDPVAYLDLVRPLPEYKNQALTSVQEFSRSCVKWIPDTTITTVDMPDIDAKSVETFAKSIGAKFRLRPFLDEYEDQ